MLPQLASRPAEQMLELPEGATVAEALAAAGVRSSMVMLVSVGDQARPRGYVLAPGDDMVVVPPVSGG
jgi:sulfur carrier protein ThiS